MHVRVSAMTFLSMVLLAGSGAAQEGSSGASLKLTLEIGKTALVLGEPVYATVRLVNGGATPVEVIKLLDPQTGTIHIDVSRPDRPRFQFLPLFYADAVRARAPLAPRAEVAAAFPIFYGSLGWTFDRPGTYRVTVEYRDPRGMPGVPVRSEPVDVTVIDEGGAAASLINGGAASEEAAKFLLWQRGDHLSAGQTLLMALVKEHPASPVADYAQLAFGRNLSRGFRNYASGQIREPDCPSALEYFRRVRPDQLPALLRVQQRLDEARCYIRMSQPRQADEAMKQAERLRDGHPEFGLLFQQARRLEPRLLEVP